MAYKKKELKLVCCGECANVTPVLAPHHLLNVKGEPILYNSMISAEKDGFHGQNISHCIRGKQHTHMGYKWYKQDEQLNIETL